MCEKCEADKAYDSCFQLGFDEGYRRALIDVKSLDLVMAGWIGVLLVVLGFALGKAF